MIAIDVEEAFVRIERPTSNVVQLTLNGFSAANYLGMEGRRKAIHALESAAVDPSVSALILTGAPGGSFCGGGDAREIQNLRRDSDVDEWLDSIVELYLSLLRCPKPIVAAIGGQTKGQGLQISLLCDMRIAGYGARFAEPELVHGVGCAIGGTILRHFISYGVMTEMVYGCREIGALTALEYNLVNFAVQDSELMSTALHWAEQLAAYSPAAFAHTKRILAQNMIDGLESCLPAARAMHKCLLTTAADSE